MTSEEERVAHETAAVIADARPATADDLARVESVVAAAGWCAPTPLLYGKTSWDDPDADPLHDLGTAATTSRDAWPFPTVTVNRGGIHYDFLERTPAQQVAHAAVTAAVNRIVANFARARDAAVDAACVTALANGWDVHVYDPPTPYDVHRSTDTELLRLRCIGIRFTPANHPMPTLVHHQAPEGWEYMDDDDWDWWTP